MKTCIHLLTIITLLTSCQQRQKNFQEQIQDIKKDFSKKAETGNAKILALEKVIDSIYKLEKEKPKLFKELIYYDREEKVLLMYGVD